MCTGDKYKEITFDYYTDGTDKIFPIDYSIREFSKGRKGGPRAVRQRLLAAPLLNDILLQLLHSDNTEKAVPPIPLEAELFLDKFCNLSENEKSLYGPVNELDDQTISSFFKELSKELYRAVAEIKNTDIKDSNAFCRHVLFDNAVFQQSVFETLWEEKIGQRYCQLQAMSKTMSFENKIQALVIYLLALDSTILKLHSCQRAMGEPDMNAKEAIRCILRSLLSPRTQAFNPESRCYRIDNVSIDDSINMEDAFIRLKGPKWQDDQLMYDARQAYLVSLTNKVLQSPFEQDYLAFQEYLEFTSHPIGDEELTSFIRERCKKYCQNIIDRFNDDKYFTFPDPYQVSESPNYIEQLIDEIVELRMRDALKCFPDLIRLIDYYQSRTQFYKLLSMYQDFNLKNKLSRLKEQTRFDIGNLSCTPTPYPLDPEPRYSEEAISFATFLQRSWDFLYREDSKLCNLALFDESTHRRINTDTVVTTLYENSVRAANFFEREDLFQYSAEEIEKMFSVYDYMIENPYLYFSPCTLLDTIPPILKGIFLQVLYKVIIDSEQALFNSLKYLLHAFQ